MSAIEAARVAKLIRGGLMQGGTVTGVGSLPHRDVSSAVDSAFSVSEVPYIPTLPRLNPAEGMIAQAVTGITGISVGHYGSLLVDPSRIDPAEPVVTDLAHGAFSGYRETLDRLARETGDSITGALKWQFIGPVTLGQALVRAGIPSSVAFDVASHAVRSHVANLYREIAAVAPQTVQLVVIDEPDLGSLMSEAFPIAPDTAIDLMSSAMAAVEGDAVVGLHCCAPIDIVPLLAAGPAILSIPVSRHLTSYAGALASFLERDGLIAWGVVPTDGPVMATAERSWRQLSKLWCELVQEGCDALRLWRQSLLTPACGLANHTVTTSDIIMSQVREIAERIRTQAVATRLTVGA
jgi:hypothetical protein